MLDYLTNGWIWFGWALISAAFELWPHEGGAVMLVGIVLRILLSAVSLALIVVFWRGLVATFGGAS